MSAASKDVGGSEDTSSSGCSGGEGAVHLAGASQPMTKPLSAGVLAQQKKKKRQEKAAVRHDLERCMQVLLWVEENPSLVYQNGLFRILRPYVYNITSQPHTYQLGKVHEEAATAAVPPPSAGFSLSSRFLLNLCSEEVTPPTGLTLHIIASETRKKMKSKFACGREFQQQIRVTLSDGTHKLLGIVETQLAGTAPNMFGEGVVLLIHGYTVHRYQVNNDSEHQLGLLFWKADQVGFKPVTPDDDKLRSILVSPMWGDGNTPYAFHVPGDDSVGVALPFTCPTKIPVGPSKEDPAMKDDYDPANTGCCDGSWCSICGHSTLQCLLERKKMPELEVIARDCFFVDRPIDEMTNEQKRFLLYWWWAVNVFSISGRANRQELPFCIRDKIRSMYPEDDATKYTGFKTGK